MRLNGKKKEINDYAMKQMVGKDYYCVEGSKTEKCKVLDVIDPENVLVVNGRGEETPVSIFDLRAV